MQSHGLLFNLIVYLGAAVIAVPLFVRLGLGSVLGYLVAGTCIGPWGLGFIENVGDILHFSEFGVVLLLFLIGLELEPAKLWGMRGPILGAGGLQMGITTTIIFFVAYLFGISWQTSLIIGIGLSLSSTAIALQILNEQGLLSSHMGKTGFSILLFQDISVIPVIALIPLLGVESLNQVSTSGDISALVIVTTIVAILIIGRYALRYIFQFVAATHLPEIFTALSLLLVVGIAGIMQFIGVSMALGAFLGGVILADSEYRHALESDIEPFKGLLLGLFFISVGMSIDFGLLFEKPLTILLLSIGLVAIKAIVLFGLSIVTGVAANRRGLFSFLFSQSGEFAFVLFGFAVAANAMAHGLADQLILVVAMSMVMTPLLMIGHKKYIEPRFEISDDLPMDQVEERNDIILVGFGRFGQIVGRILQANGIKPTVIDRDPNHIERVRRFGYKAYYGDASKSDILHSIGAEKASYIILAGNDSESTNLTVDIVQKEFPNLKIIARAYDRPHAMHLIDKGVDSITRESFYSALEMARKTLGFLGIAQKTINRISRTYIEHDVSTLLQQTRLSGDEKAIISIARTATQQLELTLEADCEEEVEKHTKPNE